MAAIGAPNPLGLDLKTQDSLLGLGVLTLSLLGVNDQPMSQVIKSAVTTQFTNTTFLSTVQTAMKAHGSDENPILALALLNSFIQAQHTQLGDQTGFRHKQLRIGWIFQGFTFCFVILRLYVKKFVVGKVRRDDWAMVVAFLVNLGLSTVEQIGCNEHHACEHIWDLSYDFIRQNLRSLYIIEICYLFTSFTCKSAIMLFYWDLVPYDTSIHFFHTSIKATFVLVCLVVFYSMFVLIFQCKPVNYWENPATAVCLPRQWVFTMSSALLAATDLMVLVLPIKVVWNLKLRKREKGVISGLFALGTVACAAATYRLIIFAQMVDHTDITYNQCLVSIWSVLEGCLAIIAACIPATKALASRYAIRFKNRASFMMPKKIFDSFTLTKTMDTLRSDPGNDHPSPTNLHTHELQIRKITEVAQTVTDGRRPDSKEPPQISLDVISISRRMQGASLSSSTEALRGSADIEQVYTEEERRDIGIV